MDHNSENVSLWKATQNSTTWEQQLSGAIWYIGHKQKDEEGELLDLISGFTRFAAFCFK